MPITWDDGFPLIGLPGNLRKAPNTWIKPDTPASQQDPTPAFPHDMTISTGPKLNNTWQWNHVEDDTKWSLTEKKGVLRMHSLPVGGQNQTLYYARNTLCMKPPAPESIMTVEVDALGHEGRRQRRPGRDPKPFAFPIGFVKTAEGAIAAMSGSVPVGGGGRRGGAGGGGPTVVKGPDNPPNHLWLRLHCNFDTNQCQYSYSIDGKQFINLGAVFAPSFSTNTTFQGCRPGLYMLQHRPTRHGGYADFDNFCLTILPVPRGINATSSWA